MNNHTTNNDISMQSADGMEQYLTFMLADESYGIEILRVQEIKGWDGVTSMPNMPDYILGVINLRGTVVPVIHLRKLFKLEAAPFSKTTVVIVVRVKSESGEERTMGLVVDAVSEVFNISKENIQPAPDFSGACKADAIKGLATQENSMLILLDIDHLINDSVIGIEADADVAA